MKRILKIISMSLFFSILFSVVSFAGESEQEVYEWAVYDEDTYDEEDWSADGWYWNEEDWDADGDWYGEEEDVPEVEPINVDTSKKIKPGGDKIHMIKLFEQRCGSDAILLESDGHYGMVDVGLPYDFICDGARDTENSVVNYLESYGVEKLDFIILTHMHIDHIGNLENVLRSFPVNVVYARSFDYPTAGFVYFLNRKKADTICKQYHVETDLLQDGQELALGKLTVKAFNLDDTFHTSQENGGDNNNCVGILVTDSYEHKAFLAADINNYDGDEDRMVEKHAAELSDVDYLKVGHHGYAGSSTYDFITMLNPRYVAISGWEISEAEDPFGDGNSVRDNFLPTRAAAQDAFFTMYDSKNGVIFQMGENLSINDRYTSPSRKGKAANTLNVYYNANGGAINEKHQKEYYIDPSGTIRSLKEDWTLDKNIGQQKAQDGVIAPMYYYDRDRSFEKAREFGLTRKGHTFAGWYNAGDKNQVYFPNKKYKVLDLAPNLKKDSSKITLLARWNANPYRILFYANGGTGSMDHMDCLYNKRETLLPNRFWRDRFVFRGWNTQPDGSGLALSDEAQIKNLTDKKDKVVTLYAQWEKIGIGTPQSSLLSSK